MQFYKHYCRKAFSGFFPSISEWWGKSYGISAAESHASLNTLTTSSRTTALPSGVRCKPSLQFACLLVLTGSYMVNFNYKLQYDNDSLQVFMTKPFFHNQITSISLKVLLLSSAHHPYQSPFNPEKYTSKHKWICWNDIAVKTKYMRGAACVKEYKKGSTFSDIHKFQVIKALNITNLRNFFCQPSVPCILDHRSMARMPRSLANSTHCLA